MSQPPLQQEVSSRGRTPSGARTVPLYTLLLPIAALILVLIIRAQMPDGRLHMWVLDVGQGDAIMIRTPGGHTALIDGGPGATPLLTALGRNLPFWQHQIDLVILTHPHDDHLLGFVELAGRYSIGQVVQTPFTSTLGNDARTYWLRSLQGRN